MQAKMLAGSVVATSLSFIRFGLVVNFIQLLVWGLLVVIPFLVSPPVSFTWSAFRATNAQYLLQGFGLDSTFLLYGTQNNGQ